MKRVVTVLMIVGMMVVVGNARARTMNAGVKGGINIADVGGSDKPSNTSMQTGFLGGLFYGVHFTDRFGARAEALWARKGVKASVGDEAIKLDYIDIPLLLDVLLPANDKLGFDVFLGPSFDFNAKAKATSGGVSVDIKDEVKGFEFGAVIGAGACYQLSSVSVLLDARYSLGATSFSKDVAGQSVDIKNRGIGIMVGISKSLGSK